MVQQFELQKSLVLGYWVHFYHVSRLADLGDFKAVNEIYAKCKCKHSQFASCCLFATDVYLVTETIGFLLCEHHLISLALYVHFSLECNTCVCIEVIFVDSSERHCLMYLACNPGCDREVPMWVKLQLHLSYTSSFQTSSHTVDWVVSHREGN